MPELDPTSLCVSALDYELPEERVATRPVVPRDAARLLVVRISGDEIEHRRVDDLPSLLRAGDALVVNRTAVAPARLVGRRADTGGRVEGLFLDAPDAGRWRVMLRSNGRLRPGVAVELDAAHGHESTVPLVLQTRHEDGTWTVGLDRLAPSALDDVGRTPLPPYILQARRAHGERVDDADDRRWYQTVYADASRRGSVAAPTAGLHFTPALLAALEGARIPRLPVTLHVGPGTFLPIRTETIDAHRMHRERYEVPAETLDHLRGMRGMRGIRGMRASGGRVIAVGTTTVRTLESLPVTLPAGPVAGETDLLIAPPHEFRNVDGMLTNFHLPRSTLLALVAAMIGLERMHAVYRIAIEHEYRFYSYGDAMLVLP